MRCEGAVCLCLCRRQGVCQGEWGGRGLHRTATAATQILQWHGTIIARTGRDANPFHKAVPLLSCGWVPEVKARGPKRTEATEGWLIGQLQGFGPGLAGRPPAAQTY